MKYMETSKVPFYAKLSLTFIGLLALIVVLYIAQHIILPIIYSVIIAVALSPLVDYFVKRGINRILAISISITVVILMSSFLILLISSQLTMFIESFPKLLNKFYETINISILWTSEYLNISPEYMNEFIADTKNEILSSNRIGNTLAVIGSALMILFLIPVYVFMILFYQPLLIDFIHRLFGTSNHKKVSEVLVSTKSIIQKYLAALLLEATIIAVLNTIGLLLIGIDYAIMLGTIGAILNIIPYIGGIVAVSLPMMIAFATKPPSYVLLVLAVYIIIQFIDNHYVIPKVVASKVRINALISIIVVLAGGALWGIPGMFLSIPLTAILKVICDHINALKPWGFLLGDTIPAIAFFKLKLKNK
jgi:predicted PurR-regulated permease PerM